MDNTTETFQKIDSLYADKKARNFFNHIVRSYFPIKNIEKIENKTNGALKCIISGEVLTTFDDILDTVKSEEFKDNLPNLLRVDDLDVPLELKTMKINGVLGITAKGTNTHMSLRTLKIFQGWIIGKLMSEDKHITWLLKDINRINGVGQPEKSSRPKAINKGEKSSGKATFKLGDAFGALQALKDKMDSK